MLPYTMGPLHLELQVLVSVIIGAQRKLQDYLALNNKALWLDSAKRVLGIHTHSSDIHYETGMLTLPIAHQSNMSTVVSVALWLMFRQVG